MIGIWPLAALGKVGLFLIRQIYKPATI